MSPYVYAKQVYESSENIVKIAIVVHVFYENLWPEMRRQMRNFSRYSPDVFITTPENIRPQFLEVLHNDFPNAKIERLPNCGFDVGPFIKVLSEINLDCYDYIVKLHTKRNRFGIVNFQPLFGNQWRRKLLAFCNSEIAVKKALDIFTRDSSVGMIGGDSTLLVRPWNELSEAPISEEPTDTRVFVAGTMFIVRAHLLKGIPSSVSFADFAPTTRQTLDTLAHKWERRLGHIVTEHGMSIRGIRPCGHIFSITLGLRKRLYYTVRRIFYRVKHALVR